MYDTPQANFALHGRVVQLSGGVRGIRQTLAAMRQMVKAARKDVDLLTVARNIIFLTPAKDDMAEIDAIFSYVRDNIRYTRDINDVETLSSPQKTLLTRVGDCDDKSTLLATLLECVGYPTRFVVAGYNAPNEFEHVYVDVWSKGNWIPLDSTENQCVGWEPPNPTAVMIEKV